MLQARSPQGGKVPQPNLAPLEQAPGQRTWVLLGTRPHRRNGARATPNDIFYAVARCPNHRFQVDAVDADSVHARNFPKHTHIIRAVQGHGCQAQDQIADAAAHRRITARSQAPVCCHAAKSWLWRLESTGLIPGALEARGHVHCGQENPGWVSALAGFRWI